VNKKDKLNKVLEGYKPIAMKRLYYPRKMNLSEDFVNAFHAEYDRLVGEGQNPRSLIDRFGKALKFHVNETRRYKQPVVEGNDDKKEETDDRRTAQGDHAPGPEGGGQSGHSGIGREVTRAQRDKRAGKKPKKTKKPKFGKNSEHQDFAERQGEDQS
jgi:hypothetical protein